MGDEIVFGIGLIVGISMAAFPNFVLFRPSRSGKKIYNIIGEKNWPNVIRVLGIFFAVLSAFVLLSGSG